MIRTMSREAFIADTWQVGGKKVSKERLLSDTYATAVDSVGLPMNPDSDAVRMFHLVSPKGGALRFSATRSRRGRSSCFPIFRIINC